MGGSVYKGTIAMVKRSFQNTCTAMRKWHVLKQSYTMNADKRMRLLWLCPGTGTITKPRNDGNNNKTVIAKHMHGHMDR